MCPVLPGGTKLIASDGLHVRFEVPLSPMRPVFPPVTKAKSGVAVAASAAAIAMCCESCEVVGALRRRKPATAAAAAVPTASSAVPTPVVPPTPGPAPAVVNVSIAPPPISAPRMAIDTADKPPRALTSSKAMALPSPAATSESCSFYSGGHMRRSSMSSQSVAESSVGRASDVDAVVKQLGGVAINVRPSTST